MKFTRFLALAVLLGCSAVVAHADGDPTVKINKFPADPPCGDPTLPAGTLCIQNGQAVSFDLNGTTIFDVGGTVPITSFSLSFQGVSGAPYSCFTDIFVTCSMIDTGTTVVMDFFTGGPGPCENNGSAGGTCPGVLAPGSTFSVEGDGFLVPTPAILNAPEPSSYLLLIGGVAVLFAFRKKRQTAVFAE